MGIWTLLWLALVPVQVKYVVPEWVTGAPAVVLEDTVNHRLLPIFVGTAEALAIERGLKGDPIPRPLTHDLLLLAIQALGGEVQRVVVTDLRKQVYYAEIWLRQGQDSLKLDARPSDAIALALRAGAPIFVDERVFRAYERSRLPRPKKQESF